MHHKSESIEWRTSNTHISFLVDHALANLMRTCAARIKTAQQWWNGKVITKALVFYGWLQELDPNISHWKKCRNFYLIQYSIGCAIMSSNFTLKWSNFADMIQPKHPENHDSVQYFNVNDFFSGLETTF